MPSSCSNSLILEIGQSYAFFFYDDIQWGLFSNIGFGPSFFDPTGSTPFMIPTALTPDTINIENTSNVGITGVYAFRVDQLLILQPGIPNTRAM